MSVFRLLRADRSFEAGQLVTALPSEQSATVRCVHPGRIKEWRAAGILGSPHPRPKVLPEQPIMRPAPQPSKPLPSVRTAWNHGKVAKLGKLKMAACPYPPKTPQGAAWKQGWRGNPLQLQTETTEGGT